MRRMTRSIAGRSLLCFALLFGVSGCGAKQETGELTPQDEGVTSTLELTSSETVVSQAAPESASGVTVVSAITPASSSTSFSSAFTALPQGSVERAKAIQLALKQAGYYGGSVDGKVGPLTQKAIEDFQRAKGLKADGRVGSVTWAELEKYLPEESQIQ